MNFRVSKGRSDEIYSFGEVIYNLNDILIESDFQETIVRENSAGSIFCFGSVKSKDKFKKVESCLDLINKKSLHSVVKELEGRFLLLFITKNELYACSDQFGKLDIYYQINENNVSLTSNLDLLPESPAKDGFNQDALVHTLTYYGFCPPKKDTLYNSVKRLGVDECVYSKW